MVYVESIFVVYYYNTRCYSKYIVHIIDAPPDSPTVSDLVIVGTSPTGDFNSHTNMRAQYLTGGWLFYTPFKWMDAVVGLLQTRMVYDGEHLNMATKS